MSRCSGLPILGSLVFSTAPGNYNQTILYLYMIFRISFLYSNLLTGRSLNKFQLSKRILSIFLAINLFTHSYSCILVFYKFCWKAIVYPKTGVPCVLVPMNGGWFVFCCVLRLNRGLPIVTRCEYLGRTWGHCCWCCWC